MQRIRAIKIEDFNQIKTIWEKFFIDQFSFPDFISNFLCAFVIEDSERDEIIIAGGVRTIAESIMMTNKDYLPIKVRREALLDMLTAMTYMAKIAGYDELHAFIQEDNWKRHLIKNGFVKTRGDSLVLSL